jgi:hypothetical protein
MLKKEFFVSKKNAVRNPLYLFSFKVAAAIPLQKKTFNWFLNTPKTI